MVSLIKSKGFARFSSLCVMPCHSLSRTRKAFRRNAKNAARGKGPEKPRGGPWKAGLFIYVYFIENHAPKKADDLGVHPWHAMDYGGFPCMWVLRVRLTWGGCYSSISIRNSLKRNSFVFLGFRSHLLLICCLLLLFIIYRNLAYHRYCSMLVTHLAHKTI